MKIHEDSAKALSPLTAAHEGLQLYLFGSATIPGGATPNDVDVLLVYDDGLLEAAHTLAEEIRSIPADPPYDVLVASKSETAELDLLAKQKAVPI